MAKKKFDVHDLYPADYCFDWVAFEADPESFVFTPNDIAYMNARALESYELKVPMTSYEKKALRKWVMSGHSPYENPGSKYLPVIDMMPYDFIDVYRLDKEVAKDIKGMNEDEYLTYVKDYFGWD